ncbi:hypothetical protein ACKI2N_024640 [Cupriavidus sp. 30B13]|uniref:hypothetical protein n=1 Tax=Cupriavidus sp. 30B13 TaxID=3384241 RepID=UPI003CF2747E
MKDTDGEDLGGGRLMRDTWPMPALLGLLSLGGLAAGIFGDGAWDWLCWLGLGVPVGVTARLLWRQWRRFRAGRRAPGNIPGSAPARADGTEGSEI